MTPTVALVPLTRAHVDQLLVHEREMFGPEAWSRAAYRAEIADPTRHYVAAVDPDGALLGWAGVMVAGPSADVLTVGVVPSARRSGIGRQLLAALLSEARARGADEAFLEVRVDNHAARALYRGDGFVELGLRIGYYDYGRVDAVTMRKDLSVEPAERLAEPTGGGRS